MSALIIALIGLGSGAYGAAGALIAHQAGKPNKWNLAPLGQFIIALIWPLLLLFAGWLAVYE